MPNLIPIWVDSNKLGSWFKRELNLVELNCKNKRCNIANGGCNWPKWTENCGEDELWKWRACFPCKCDTGRKTNSKRATPDVVTIKKPKTIFEFGLLSIIAYLHHSSSFISFLSSISSRFFFFFLLQKHATRYATELPAFQPATLSSFLNTEHRIQMWFMHIKQIYFVH